ncbi:LicD family protein [Methanobrevibacter sp.]|uniref:LicD family protein n=1 Tax=Methanobrevibacter sp. TaxID=66852 RepID=UPI00386A1A3F
MLFDKFKKNDDSIDIIDFNEDEFVTRHEFEKLKRLAETQQDYLNNLYIFYELEPTPFLKGMRELSYELMKFVDNVCAKHDIEYWMDYGTLLGSVRHNAFVPWDDDLDVGIMRKDYNRLVEILPEEINQNDLPNLIADFKIDKHNFKSKRWYQLSYKRPEIKAKFIGVDFFPYDYITKWDSDLDEEFNNALTEYYHNPDEYTLEEYLDKFYRDFNLTLDKTDMIIPGIDNARGDIPKYAAYKHILVRTDEIFPLIKRPFGKYEFPAPQNSVNYIKDIYGLKYMQIPRKIRDHGRLNKFKKRENVMEMLDEGIDMLKKANENY